MTDSKLTKKHHPQGSISRRILTVAILLLVIPLALQTIFLYRQEYREKLEDVKEILTLLGTERANVKPLYMATAGKDFNGPFPIQIALISEKGKVVWQNGTFPSGSDLVEVLIPIPKSGSHLKLATSKRSIRDLHLSTYIYRLATLLFFVGGIGGLLVYLFTKRINRPLKNLCQAMERVSEGAIHARYLPDWMGFEINKLGLQFNDTLDSLLGSLQEIEKERLRRQKLAEELRIGHEIQQSLVPNHAPGFLGLDIATKYLSAKEVNGDFYDLFTLPDKRLLMVICDTAGKGISACLYSLGLRSMIRTSASMNRDMGQWVREVNDLYFLDAHETSMFSTLWIGIFDSYERSLTYCSQGHPPAMLLRHENIEELWTNGIAMGAQKLAEVETKKIILEKGDLLVLYTDGIIEAHNQQEEMFGKKRLKASLLMHNEFPSEKIANRLVEEVKDFGSSTELEDDVTLVVCRF